MVLARRESRPQGGYLCGPTCQPARAGDDPLAVLVLGVIEGPVHGLQAAGLLVLAGGAIVEGDKDRLGIRQPELRG